MVVLKSGAEKLEPNVTGTEFLEGILSVLESIKLENEVDSELSKLICTLKNVSDELKFIDSSIIGKPLSRYKLIEDHLKKLGIGYESKYLYQCDMIKPLENNCLSKTIVDDVFEGIKFLNKITLSTDNVNLAKFITNFIERYEDQEVLLIEALDGETGIGYNQSSGDTSDYTPLIENIVYNQKQTNFIDIRINLVQALLYKKLIEALKEHKTEIELTSDDVKDFNEKWDDLPNTMSVMFQKLDKKLYISSVGGSSAANLLGRFCHSSVEIHNFCCEITQKEKELNYDAINAEIVHLPESRTGNILMRTNLREYEIPYLAKSSVSFDCQIRLDDLMISIRNHKINLRSLKLNKEIIPHLTNAHNYTYNSLPIYNFLADIQNQGKRQGLYFNWGQIANEHIFLPRILFKNLIFSLARWIVIKQEVEPMLLIISDGELINAVNNWRISRGIPTMVSLSDGDNFLYINLEIPLMVRTLFSTVKNRNSFILEEFISNSKYSMIRSDEGDFNNQFILCFYKEVLTK